METKSDQTMMQKTERDRKELSLPNAIDVVSEWFSQEHPDRLKHLLWNKDHNQYHEYHKSL